MRQTLVRTRRSFMPNGAIRRLNPDSHTAPPCGASESPHTVTISERARGGSAASALRIQRETSGSGLGAGVLSVSRFCDTVLPWFTKKVYRIGVRLRQRPIQSTSGDFDVCTNG